MYNYLVKGDLPTNDKAARRLILDAENYIVENGALYHLYSPRTKNLQRCFSVVKQLCVPKSLRAFLAHGLHESVSHPGWERVYATARGRYYFPKMYEFLKSHVLSYEACQKSKPVVHPNKTPIQNLPVCEPLSRWVLDHHGPLVNSDGFTHILVAIDSSSMWVELIPVKDVSAKTTIQALFDNVIARFGLCSGFSVQSDRCTAFANELAT